MDKIEQLYKLYIEKGLITSETSLDDFANANKDIQGKLYELGKTEGLFVTTGLNDFQSTWAPAPAKTLDPADVDPTVESKNNTGSISTDGSLESQDIKPFTINGREVSKQEFEDYTGDTVNQEVYGEYLKKDGTTGYNEKPYSVQLQDYKSGFESILKAEGVYSFLKDYDMEYRQDFAATQLANKAPRYTREQYDQSTDSYKSVPTKDGAKAFAKNLPKNFDIFDDKKDFNIALEQSIQKTISEDPLINYQIKIASKKAQQELKDYALSLREKYDLETPEGISLAEKDYSNRWKELVINPVAESQAYKNTIKDLQLVAAEVGEKQNINFGRYKDSFLSSVDFIDRNDPTGIFSGLATNIIEPIVGTVAGGMVSSFNNAQVAAQQISLEKDFNTIARLKKDLKSGKIKEDTKATYGGTYSQKEGYTIGGQKGTVKDKIKYLEDQLKSKNESIAVDIEEAMKASEYQSLFTKADFSDGVGFEDILKTISASAPYMAVAAAGTMTGNPVLAGAGFMSMFTQEYGDSYMGVIRQGLENDGLEYSEKNILDALSEGKYASQAESVATAFVSASLEQVGATKVAKNTMSALGLGGTLKKSLGSLYRGEVKQFVKSTARGAKQQSIAGAGEAVTELGQNLTQQISTGVQLEGISGIGRYIDTEANREAALAGGFSGFFIPFGASVFRQTVSELRNAARDVATKFDLTSEFGGNLKAVNSFFTEAESNLKRKLDNGEIDGDQYQEESQNLNTIRNIGVKIPKKFSAVNKKKAFDLILEKDGIEKSIENKDPELVKEEVGRIKEINAALNKISNVEQKTNKALEASKKVISNFVQTDAKGAEQILKEEEKNKLQKKFSKGEISEKEFQKDIQKLAEDKNILDADADAFFKDDGSFVLIMDRISDKGVFNTAAHEILHKVLYNTIVSVDKDGKKQGAEVIKGLSNALKSELDKMDPSIIKDKKFQSRLELYKSEPESVKAEEVLTLFSDALAYGEISYSDSLGTKLKDIVRRVLQNLGIREVEFNTGEDVYNFLKDYNRGIKKGKLSSTIVKASKEGVKVGTDIERLEDDFEFDTTKESKSTKSTPLEAINALVPNTVKTQAEYFSPRVFNPIYNALEDNGVISNYIKSKSPSKEVASKTIESIRERLINFDPEATRKNKDNAEPVTFGEFIFANTNFGKLDAKKALFKESQEDSNKIDIDSEQAKGIAVVESSTKKAEAPEYRKIIDSNVLFKDVVSNVKAKVLKTVRTLKSKLDANVSNNKTVTPIIAEIKKEMGKQADIDLKKAIGGKANGQMERFLIKNKKAILENMTTTWLTKAIPGAIQKMVNGNWTSDWSGKKIDRESTKTDNAGRTSGAEMTRRKPNAANMSDAEFLGYFLDSKGDPIRGRKESLAKAMAEEISLEIFNKELQDENSDISKAFENNQQLKGVVLVDGFVAEVSKQIERGNVKFSKTLNGVEGGVDYFVKEINTAEFKRLLIDTGDLKMAIGIHFKGKFKAGLLSSIVREVAKNNVVKNFEFHIKKSGKETAATMAVDYISKDLFTPSEYASILAKLGLKSGYDLRSLSAVNQGRLASSWLKLELGENKFIRGFYRALSGPARLAGFELKNDPNSISVLESDIKQQSKNARNGLFNSVRDITKALGILSTKNIFRNSEQTRKNWWFSGKFNKLSDQGKKEYLQELYKEGQIDKDILIEAMDLLRKGYANGDVSLTGVQMLWVGQFADMTGVGKAAAAPRMIPVIKMPDGSFKIATHADLLKAGLAYSKDPYVLEHMTPAKEIATLSLQYILTGDISIRNDLIKKLENYDTSILPKKLDDKLKEERGTQEMMGIDYKIGDSPVDTRYDGLGIMFYDAKNDTYVGSQAVYSKSELTKVKNEQKAIDNATSVKWSKSPKKIRVFDFDDTLAQTKSNVLYTMPDGTTGKIDAATFAKDAGNMEAEGAVWDFSEFSKVMNGKKGPLFEVAKIIADKRGTEDVFVLTARPADAAGPIQEFLASMGLNIPIENITGLGNGAPKAKADWMISKVAEGYNDFYFADDHTGNVNAVKDVLDTFDVKGKVQLAKVKFSKSLDPEFNSMIERNKGVGANKEFSRVVAKRGGANKGKYKAFITSSADDFRGLTSYTFAGKGKQGEADQAFFEDALLTPYFRGVNALESARVAIKSDFEQLGKIFKPEVKKLSKLTPDGDFTYDQALRVYMWNKQGTEIPGISKRDQAKLVKLIEEDAGLKAFSEAAVLATKKDGWPDPGEYWDAKTMLSDLNDLTETSNRAEYIAEFIENADIIFSEKNLNKIEAVYGTKHREALEDALYAMKNGTNRSSGSNKITNKWNNWVNNSIGTIMFFNRRSALMQTLSITNFLNWSDNNPLKAGLAFANQPQYWKDFVMIFNSDKLKQRRGGLKSDVQEAEIANAAKGAKNKPQAIISYLLKKGFLPTQIADSFAISMGGASMYRNRVNTYKNQGFDLKTAEEKAFLDFSKISDETQQSGDPALVSQQQRSVAGRVLLSFQNTTMQYTRLMKKSAQDLINGRGDPKTHISKIIYYGAVQNFIFNALSASLFALIPGFGDEDEEGIDKKELDKKSTKILNGMFDSVAKGTGIYGAVVVTLKNAYRTYTKEKEKGFMGQPGWQTASEMLNIAPAIGSKFKKVKSAIDVAEKYDKDIIEKHPWDVAIGGRFNPSSTYTVIGNLSSALLNIPLDRALAEAKGISEMLDDRNTAFQRVALGLGWRTWDVGAKNEEFDLIKSGAKKEKKKDKSTKNKRINKYIVRDK